jgi:Short C-terminal domain
LSDVPEPTTVAGGKYRLQERQMAELTPEGQRIVEDAARRYGMSNDAVRVLLEALMASGGGMAQFNHPDLGGMGQWSSGGMIMIGDMFNNGLKNTIANLCGELSTVVGRADVIADRPRSSQWQSQSGSNAMPLPENSLFVSDPSRFGDGTWWPSDLGMPASTGAQNNMRYACFPDRRRLALDVNGQISVYDTGDHWISGFSQQQSGDQSLTFTSQYGLVRLDSLPLVLGSGQAPGYAQNALSPAPRRAWQPAAETPQAGGDIFTSIERLGALRDKGFISEAEFAAKKSELLGRL